jgi:hypothetical protein
MKEANKIPSKMPLDELLDYALNVEEAAVNPGIDNEGNSNNLNNKKTETTVPKKKGGRTGKFKKGGYKSILDGQERPTCTVCDENGHIEALCRIKTNDQDSAKKETKNKSELWKNDKAEKQQAFASASK